MAKAGHDYPLVLSDDSVERQLGAPKALPTTRIYDPSGTLVYDSPRRVTSLSTVLAARDPDELTHEIDRLRGDTSPEAFATRVNAATVDDQVGRFRALAEAGVQTAIVNMPNLSPAAVETFAEVIAAFPPPESDTWPPF